MATKTVSLSEDAYEKLRSLKTDGESFSDVVERIAPGVKLSNFYGVLSEETAGEMKKAIDERREQNRKKHGDRIDEIADNLG